MKNALAALVISTALAFPAGAATIVQNGSFETPVPGNSRGLINNSVYGNMPNTGGGWDIWRSLPGWTLASGPGIEVQTNRTLGTIDAQDGKYYLELDSTANSAIQQFINLAVGRYQLSFYYSPRTNVVGDNGISFGVNKQTGTSSFVSLLSGSISGPNGLSAVGRWTKVSAIFNVATAGSYQLRLGAIGTSNGVGGFIDNVSVKVATVPVPAAGGMLMAAMAGLGALRRRRRG